ncbi:hypothetical protein M758_1G317100 [Ceratodon purpureus]|nr:hypothetical protein M758_1G317100 [Ceratodon purpureus]
MHRAQSRGQSRGYGAAQVAYSVVAWSLWLVKVLIMGAGEALAALYRQLKLLALTLTPGHEYELESDRAGRAAELRVSALFEGIPGVQVFTSLRIPDTGQGRGRREIDLVLVTKRELFVVEVKNWSGAIELQPDGSWLQIRRNGTVQKHSNVVDGTKYRAQLLKSYIERRGVNVPPDFVQPKVFLVNPDCKPEQAIVMQPEVLSADRWESFMENNLERTGSGWLISLLSSSQQPTPVLSEASEKQLLYILSTAPTWDRLELYGGKIVVGDFHSFQGQPEEAQTLKFAKRAVVKQLTMTHRRGWVGHTLGFLVGRTPKVKVVVTVRDHRDANITKISKNQDPGFPLRLEVRPDMKIVFQPVANPKPVHYNLNDVLSLTLSA